MEPGQTGVGEVHIGLAFDLGLLLLPCLQRALKPMTARGWPKVTCLGWTTALGLRGDLMVAIPAPATRQAWLDQPKLPPNLHWLPLYLKAKGLN